MERRFVIAVMCVAVVSAVGGIYLTLLPQQNVVRVAFLDVGQGDSIFIETPTGNQIVIDAGMDERAIVELGTLMRPGDKRIDVVIATHPDADHIGGLVDVLSHYDVGMYVESGATATTELFTALSSVVQSSRVPVQTARIGDRIISDDGVTFDVLAPYGTDDETDTNAHSIVLRMTYGDFSVLLTGDAPTVIEQDLVRWYGNQLESEIIKAGHHGSRTSTSESFVTAINPLVGIISAGKGNRYGHPHPEVMATFADAEVPTLGTYDEGTIVFESDGRSVWRK